MHSEAQTIARLKSMVFLIEEALRIADEGDNPMLGAKLSDCIDCLQVALSQTKHDARVALAASSRPTIASPGPAALTL